MIWDLSIDYILLHSVQEYDPDTYGFPYCILLYSMAFFANVTVFILFVIEAVREHRRQISHDKHILSEPGGQLQHTL